MNNFLEVNQIYKKFSIGNSTLEVLKGASFSVTEGEWVTLLGTSGSGKTTLLDIVGTISTPDSGTVLINGVNPAKRSQRQLAVFRQEQIGFVFQAYHILPELNILENVMLPLLFTGKVSRKECQERAKELLVMTGLENRIKHHPNELSGGEQQRAAIARALINRPALLLADEPTGNLDSKTGTGILKIFEKIRENNRTTILMVTHDEHIASLSDRALRIREGKIE
ncbi:MAG: ABC transporter ATP-binding protein [Lentisphaeria bacterium]|nr:ABC transporter ATP-binding protein [Lentisphaeria bacterium]